MFLFHGVHPKKNSAPALILTLLISALIATLLIGNATANPIMPPVSNPLEKITIKVQSPVKGKMYTATEIPLQFYFEIPGGGYRSKDFSVLSVRYWLDGKLMGEYTGEDLPKAYSAALTGLSDREHSVQVSMSVHYYWASNLGYIFNQDLSGSETTSFTVDTLPPSISVVSQKTFEAESSPVDVPLNFTVDKPASWIGFSLDGNNVVTATHQVASTEWFGRDNCQLVLRGVSVGGHSLTVYAEDTVGNRGGSAPFSFTVTQETLSGSGQVQPEAEQTEPFPTTLVAVALIVSVAIVFGLVAYFLRRKSNRGNQT